MQLSSHDIRMKEFRRAILRGYSEVDVDTFLMHLAADMDRRSNDQGAATNETTVEVAPPPASVHNAEAITEQAAAETIRLAQDQARQLYEAARQAATDLEHQTKLAVEHTMSEARASAERGLTKARQRAEEILVEAREHQERASRAEAEAGLRLAYVEERLAKKALVLAEESKRLSALADWLGQEDLLPAVGDDATSEDVHRPAHAAPTTGDVVSLHANP